MAHVFVRLAGYGLRLVPCWPYRFARSARRSTVQVTAFAVDGERSALAGPGASSVPGVVDVDEGPVVGDWCLEVGPFTISWPDGFDIESPRDPTDGTLFYLYGAGEAMIFPQGPVPLERLAAPDALVAPGQRVTDRRRLDDDIQVVELTYEHEGERWWQAHWTIPLGRQRAMLFTGQAPIGRSDVVRAAGDRMAMTLG